MAMVLYCMFCLCGHFYGNLDMSACITVVWDMSMRRSKINVVPFHIKVCFFFYPVKRCNRMSRADLIKQDGVKCQEPYLCVFLKDVRTKTFRGNLNSPKFNKFMAFWSVQSYWWSSARHCSLCWRHEYVFLLRCLPSSIWNNSGQTWLKLDNGTQYLEGINQNKPSPSRYWYQVLVFILVSELLRDTQP